MKPPVTAPGPKYSASLELLRLSEALWNATRLFLTRWELSPSQFNVLNLLDDRPAGCTQIELSRQLITHRSNVTGLLDRLAARGLIERRVVAGDRRVFNIVLTTSGKELMKRIQPEYYRALEQIWGSAGTNDARQFVSSFSRVVENAHRIAKEASQKTKKQGDAYARDD